MQFDEPALVWDMDKEDIALFHQIYDTLLTEKKQCKILLQTYFGDVRDIYEDLIQMPFDGIGLDFIEGKETVNLIEKYGFPQDKLLFAGLVNGKNIWKNHYWKTLGVLEELKGKNIKAVLSISCSLLHVPYTLKHEEKLPKEYLEYFAFAEEKIVELQEYIDFNKKKIAECVAWQEEIGLDVLVHGEYERNDMVEYFGEALGGFLFTEKAWVQSYGTRCVKPPVIWGDVYRRNPITVDWSVSAQSLTKKIMKGMLTGPVTILNWSFPREDISIRESISQIALAIRDEVSDLEANGIRMIQIDEAALRENHFETEVGPGVYDIHSPRVPSVEEIEKALDLMLTKIEKDKLWVNPDCG